MADDLLIEPHVIDTLTKKVISKLVEELIRESLGRLVGLQTDSRYSDHGLANETKALFLKEIQALIETDAEVKEALRKRLIAELNKKQW